jgi:uncharacterized protein (DUF58 family)
MKPRRSIRPTRDGWWCVVAAVGLGVAAVNTGNNLAYLLCALLLAVITVSGILSDLAMRGLDLTPLWPATLHAGQPALFGVVVRNRRRWLNAYSLALDVLPGGGRGAPLRTLYVARVPPGGEQVLTFDLALPIRGWRRVGGLRVTTRFPFGLFLKAGRPQLAHELLVYPALAAGVADRLSESGGHGMEAARRRGRGLELAGLRDYQPGDEPRLVHWPTTARTGRLTVRDLEEETARDTRLLLVPGSGEGPEATERGLSQAAALTVHLLRAGVAVELAGPGVLVPLDRGAGQERAILTALALYEAGTGTPAPAGPGLPGLRELTVRLG